MSTTEQHIRAEMQRKEELEKLVNLHQMGYISKKMLWDAVFYNPVRGNYEMEVDKADGEDQTWRTEYLCKPFNDPITFPHYPPADKVACEVLTNIKIPITYFSDQLREEENALSDYLYFMEEVNFEKTKENINAILLLGD